MTEQQKPDEPDERFGPTQVVDFVRDRYNLGRTNDGLLIAIPSSPKAAKIAREIGSLRGEVLRDLYNEQRKSVGREIVSAAIETLKGLAEEAPTYKVAIRSAQRGPALSLDLADSTGRYVEVSPFGWEVRDPREEDDPDAARPVFRRTAATVALPTPERGGSRDDLRRLLGFEDPDDPRWMLLWGWLVGSLFEDVPRPILWTLGQQGSGKSTRARMLLSVVDPADRLGREPGKNERDDSTSARARFIPTWDNIGSVSAATSDWLCRLVTGVQIDRRALYTDDDVRTATLQRTGVATSIVLPTGLGADALERLALVEFERIAAEQRTPESALWEEFDRLHGRILGALLDDVAGALRNLSKVRADKRPLPRMADFAQILYALDEALDLDDLEGFGAVYAESVQGVLSDRATADPLTAAVVEFVEKSGGSWEGTNEELMEALKEWAPLDSRAPWPRTPRGTSDALKKSAETLHAAGIEIGPTRKTNRIVHGTKKSVRVFPLTLVERDEERDEGGTVVPPEGRSPSPLSLRSSLQDGDESPGQGAGVTFGAGIGTVGTVSREGLASFARREEEKREDSADAQLSSRTTVPPVPPAFDLSLDEALDT